MESIGIDNCTFTRSITKEERLVLYSHLPALWQTNGVCTIRHGAIHGVYDQRQGICTMNINIPKCSRSHNVELAGCQDVERALEILAIDTGLDWGSADVKTLDIAMVLPLEFTIIEIASILKVRKGYRMDYGDETENSTIYLNPDRKTGLAQLVVYDKTAHIAYQGRHKLLQSLAIGSAHLLRIELRLLRRVRRQLKRYGWQSPYVLASDLATEHAFGSILKLYRVKVNGFLQSEGRRTSVRKDRGALHRMYELKPDVAIPILKAYDESLLGEIQEGVRKSRCNRHLRVIKRALANTSISTSLIG
jgi:hypothetical protein